MTLTTSDTDHRVVRIPADLDRPDRILLGLSARQLGILAAGGLACGVRKCVHAARRYW